MKWHPLILNGLLHDTRANISHWGLNFIPGANPTIVTYNATGSLVRFEIKNIVFYFEKALYPTLAL
jgi:hypothetical protein